MEYVADAREASLGWQGGEPTLAGIDFFERVVSLEAKFASAGATIGNALQTNGILLDDRWGEFLHRHRFLVGVSLDGPKAVHVSVRRDRGGHGSFRRVLAGIETLRRHNVEFNILCVAGPHNMGGVRDLMDFFRSEGFSYVQFIPAMDFQSVEPEAPPAYLITAEEYGDFLVELFDEWYERLPIDLGKGVRRLSNRTWACPTTSASTVKAVTGIVVEYNGDVYPCDFYISRSWFGNDGGTAGVDCSEAH
jgi:uncharacterized protein